MSKKKQKIQVVWMVTTIIGVVSMVALLLLPLVYNR